MLFVFGETKEKPTNLSKSKQTIKKKFTIELPCESNDFELYKEVICSGGLFIAREDYVDKQIRIIDSVIPNLKFAKRKSTSIFKNYRVLHRAKRAKVYVSMRGNNKIRINLHNCFIENINERIAFFLSRILYKKNR